MPFPSQDVSNQFISQSYTNILRRFGNIVIDSLGNEVFYLTDPSGSTFPISASFAISASWAPGSSVTSSYSQTSSITVFNGNRAIKRNDPDFVGINVGGTDVVSFLNNFFFPFIGATVSINSGTSYFETGSAPTITINGAVTPNDELIFGTGSVLRDSLVFATMSVPPYPYSFNDTTVSSSHTYQTFVQVDNNGSPTLINSSTKTISFIYPFLYGLSSTIGLSGNTLYTTLTKDITPVGNKTYNFSGNVVYIYVAYPSSYADLIHIYDPNLFDILTSFEYSGSVPVTSSGLVNNWTNTYKVYRLKTLADPSGNYQFRFS